VNAQELTAAYVLGELDGAELAAFERRIADDPALRAEVAAVRGTVAQLEALPGEAWPEAPNEAPSLAAVDGKSPEERVAAASVADAEPLRAPRPGSGHRPAARRRRFSIQPALAAAAIVAALVIGGAAGALIFGGDSSSSSTTAATKTVLVLHPLDAPKSSRADLSMPNADTMLLRTHGLPASTPGAYYEVWLMSSNQRLVPVASFRVGQTGEASVEVPLPASPTAFRYFDVSRQTVAGGTGHSADSVLRGSTDGLS
jgi:anti-sigma-K factor RskA